MKTQQQIPILVEVVVLCLKLKSRVEPFMDDKALVWKKHVFHIPKLPKIDTQGLAGRCKSYNFWSINQSKMLHWKVPPETNDRLGRWSNPIHGLGQWHPPNWKPLPSTFSEGKPPYANRCFAHPKNPRRRSQILFIYRKVGWNANNYHEYSLKNGAKGRPESHVKQRRFVTNLQGFFGGVRHPTLNDRGTGVNTCRFRTCQMTSKRFHNRLKKAGA